MVAWVYQLVLWLALPLVWLRLQWRARREPAYGERQAERFGQVPRDVRRGPIWFHTVSAGESIAAAPVVRAIAERFPDTPVLVTTMTPTGSAQVIERLSDVADHCYAPYDFTFAVDRFYRRVEPRALILMETELWPNLIAWARSRGIPVLLINARLSERSAHGYAKLAGLARGMLEALSFIACQSEDHVRRFVSLGAAAETTAALGSVKYDVALPEDFAAGCEDLRARLGVGERLVWIAASTHPGEDEPVLEAFAILRRELPDLCLILVPRHPHRADDVEAMAVARGFSVVRQSACVSQDERAGTPDIVLGDVMGTLLELYGIAHAAFVGGSLVPVGGHNPLEPALCHLPIASGPEQFNFTEVMKELESRGGLVTVADVSALAEVTAAWLTDADLRAAVGAKAHAALADNRGATARVVALLDESVQRALTQ